MYYFSSLSPIKTIEKTNVFGFKVKKIARISNCFARCCMYVIFKQGSIFLKRFFSLFLLALSRESSNGSRTSRALPEDHVLGWEATGWAWRGCKTSDAHQAGEHDGQPRQLPRKHGCVSQHISSLLFFASLSLVSALRFN